MGKKIRRKTNDDTEGVSSSTIVSGLVASRKQDHAVSSQELFSQLADVVHGNTLLHLSVVSQ